MISVPSITLVFPTGNVFPTLDQLILGRGTPSTSQGIRRVSRSRAVASDGGFLRKTGRPR